jgi:hypothetical protein
VLGYALGVFRCLVHLLGRLWRLLLSFRARGGSRVPSLEGTTGQMRLRLHKT